MRRCDVLGIMAAVIAQHARTYRFDEVVREADALLREAERVSPEPCAHEWRGVSIDSGDLKCERCGEIYVSDTV